MNVSVTFNNDTEKLARVEKEYRKEFLGEGQMFFYYKRHNQTQWSVPQTTTVPEGAFVLPKPKGQLAFE